MVLKCLKVSNLYKAFFPGWCHAGTLYQLGHQFRPGLCPRGHNEVYRLGHSEVYRLDQLFDLHDTWLNAGGKYAYMAQTDLWPHSWAETKPGVMNKGWHCTDCISEIQDSTSQIQRRSSHKYPNTVSNAVGDPLYSTFKKL